MTEEQSKEIFEIIEEMLETEIKEFGQEILNAIKVCITKSLFSKDMNIDFDCIEKIVFRFEEEKRIKAEQKEKEEELKLIIVLENNLKEYFAMLYGIELHKIAFMSFLEVLNEIRKNQQMKQEQQQEKLFPDYAYDDEEPDGQGQKNKI